MKAAWDQRAAGAVSHDALAAIDSEVDRYFAHPEDCRDTWVPTAGGFLRDPAMAARLRRELARKDQDPRRDRRHWITSCIDVRSCGSSASC